MYWHQRSRVNWLQLGDQNTSFFHHTTLQRRKFNRICRIQDDNGAWLDSEKEITKYFSYYFKKLFISNGPQDWVEVLDFVDNLVTADINEHLIRSVTLQEVKATVFDLGATKAPGPNSFSGVFYQNQWDTVQRVIHETACHPTPYQQFLASGNEPNSSHSHPKS